ncbi:MAG: HepT-like ribonuclease domain-containing protein [Acidimicrobiales bacterium]
MTKLERWAKKRHGDRDLYRAAVMRELGVIGEAAAHVSEDYQRRHSAIPWRRVIGLRNFLVHHYWELDRTIIDSIIRDDLPVLRSSLTALPTPEADVEELIERARSRPPMSNQPQRPRRASRTCSAWMPITRASCTLPQGHRGHHRNR